MKYYIIQYMYYHITRRAWRAW